MFWGPKCEERQEMQLAERRVGRPHTHSIWSRTHMQNLENTPTLATTVRVTCVDVQVWPCTTLTHCHHTNFTVNVSESVHVCVDFRGTYRPFGLFIRLISQAKLIMLHLHCSLVNAPQLGHCILAGIALLILHTPPHPFSPHSHCRKKALQFPDFPLPSCGFIQVQVTIL